MQRDRRSDRKPSPLDLPSFEDPSLSADAERVGEAMEWFLRSQRLRNGDQTCSFGITLTECYTLEALVREPGRTVTEVARELGLNKSTASRVLSSLEAKGLSQRRPHLEDARSIRAVASLRGIRLYERIRRTDLECHRRLLAPFSPATRQALVTILQALTCREAPALRRKARTG